MSSPSFRFKHFEVFHDQCAMKVGTDGVLLGAWCSLPLFAANLRVLDIGTGSGLIALMLAQRLANQSQSFFIDAIDIEPSAVHQATDNFRASLWKDQVTGHLTPLQQWNGAYHLIVSNPPFFQNSLKNPNQLRQMARHTDSLSYEDLFLHASRLLIDEGIFACILPAEAENDILPLATQNHLSPLRITYVHSKPNRPVKRILLEMSKQDKIPSNSASPLLSHLYIESATSSRNPEYQALTADFYL